MYEINVNLMLNKDSNFMTFFPTNSMSIHGFRTFASSTLMSFYNSDGK